MAACVIKMASMWASLLRAACPSPPSGNRRISTGLRNPGGKPLQFDQRHARRLDELRIIA